MEKKYNEVGMLSTLKNFMFKVFFKKLMLKNIFFCILIVLILHMFCSDHAI